MEETIKFLSKNVRYHRKRVGLSQQELAEKCEISTTYVGEIETGKKHPSLKTLISFSKVFDIPTYMLLIDSDNHENQSLKSFGKDLEAGISELIKDYIKRY